MSPSLTVEPKHLIVARSSNPWQGPEPGTVDWKRELAQAHTDVRSLLTALGLETDQVPDLDVQPDDFRLLVPRGFAALMTRGDPADPLLRQVLPLGVERTPALGFVADPVGDGPATLAPGLIQKYHGRALLMVHGACAIHCRYCFRRHFPYSAMGHQRPRLEAAIGLIAADTTVSEVVLSGGDPLMLDDPALAALLHRLQAIGHLRRIRLHSRLPVVLPERVTGALCAHLGALRLDTALVVHANHPSELLGDACAAAIARLRGAGVMLLNQSVLLAGVNDRTDTLASLSERLFALGVLPYYLHQLDLVHGAAHFAVSDERALALEAELRARLPGYLVPRLVREVPGDSAKRPLSTQPQACET